MCLRKSLLIGKLKANIMVLRAGYSWSGEPLGFSQKDSFLRGGNYSSFLNSGE